MGLEHSLWWGLSCALQDIKEYPWHPRMPVASLNYDHQKYLHTLSNVPQGAELPLIEKHRLGLPCFSNPNLPYLSAPILSVSRCLVFLCIIPHVSATSSLPFLSLFSSLTPYYHSTYLSLPRPNPLHI